MKHLIDQMFIKTGYISNRKVEEMFQKVSCFRKLKLRRIK